MMMRSFLIACLLHLRATAAFITPQRAHQTTALQLTQRDEGIASGVADISMGCSVGVLWSEYAVVTTGCGPLQMANWLERFCYQGVLVSAGVTVFVWIVTQQRPSRNECWDGAQRAVEVAEVLSLAAVVGAIVALVVQMDNHVAMDGLSGIDINMCRMKMMMYESLDN